MRYKGNLEALVLGTLKGGPLHGYAIAKAIEACGEGVLKLGENQLYPTLHRLEEGGFVAAEWQPQENRPPRKMYELTELGRGELAKHQKCWKQYAGSVSAVLGVNLEAQHG